jgi:hypothetical protein
VTAHRHPDLLGAVQQDLNGDGAARHFLPAEKTGLNSRAWGERTTSGHAALRAILMRSEIAETGAKAQQAPQYTCAAIREDRHSDSVTYIYDAQNDSGITRTGMCWFSVGVT